MSVLVDHGDVLKEHVLRPLAFHSEEDLFQV